jgi:hypothetical protein
MRKAFGLLALIFMIGSIASAEWVYGGYTESIIECQKIQGPRGESQSSMRVRKISCAEQQFAQLVNHTALTDLQKEKVELYKKVCRDMPYKFGRKPPVNESAQLARECAERAALNLPKQHLNLILAGVDLCEREMVPVCLDLTLSALLENFKEDQIIESRLRIVRATCSGFTDATYHPGRADCLKRELLKLSTLGQ